MNIAVLGTGYVGLVTGLCLAHLGATVGCIDRDELIVSRLNRGVPTIHEDGLEALLRQTRSAGTIRFHADYGPIADADMVFLAVGTPSLPGTGEADLSQIEAALAAIAPLLRAGAVVVVKSTVPVGTNAHLDQMLRRLRPDIAVSVASNPEFLREGSAIADFFEADRVICGVRDARAREAFLELYRPLVEMGSALVVTTPENAELSKYASNAFLAAKIAFINEIADVCERAGADVAAVATMMGMDRRIGPDFLNAGPGYGGSCFPKDTHALAATARRLGVPAHLVENTIISNDGRMTRLAQRVVAAVADRKGRRVAVLGVAFKANTDDVRSAPSLTFIPQLQIAGCHVVAHDPQAMANGKKALPGIQWAPDPLAAVEGADAVVILTEWSDYATLDLDAVAARMAGRAIFDYRNVLSPDRVLARGLVYEGIGRGAAAGLPPTEIVTVQTLSRAAAEEPRVVAGE